MSDISAVALRSDGRWTGSRLQQDRPLLDTDWNLAVDASARARLDAAGDTVGPTGVPVGSEGFRVFLVEGQPWVSAGAMWVGGLRAVASQATRAIEASAGPLGPGRWFAYLEAFADEVTASDDPSLVDPALAPIDTSTRTRVRHRVRVLPAADLRTGGDAMRVLARAVTPPPTLTISAVAPPTPPVPCDPPTPQVRLLPDGLLRFEVLDVAETGAVLLAWSFDNASTAVAVAPGGVSSDGTRLTLSLSASVKLTGNELVEVSTPERRGDQVGHGPLFRVTEVAGGPGGDVVTLDQPLPADRRKAARLVVRRWDGQWTGRPGDAEAPAPLDGADVGVRFALAGGPPGPGQWWGSRLRSAANPGVEGRAAALPEESPRFRAPLALLELGNPDGPGTNRIIDVRPYFRPLSRLSPGDDLQAAIRALPPDGGELQLSAGTFRLPDTVVVENRQRVVISGAGPATVLSSAAFSAMVFTGCEDVTVRNLRAEAGSGASPSGRAMLGTLSFWDCRGVTISGCQVACPDLAADRPGQLLVSVDGNVQRDLRLEANRFEIGAGQSGVRAARVTTGVVAGNSFTGPVGGIYRAALEVSLGVTTLRVVDNVVSGALRAMSVTAGDFNGGGGDVHIAGNVVRLILPSSSDPSVVRSTIMVRNAGSLRLLANVVTITLAAGATEHPGTVFPAAAIEVTGAFGPLMVVRHCAASGYRNAVYMVPAFNPGVAFPEKRLWLVAQCIATGVGATASALDPAVTRIDDR